MVERVQLDGRVGAMGWREHRRYEKHDTDPRPMPHLAVVTPAGLVCLDCPSRAVGTYWTRTGEPPNVTVTPSLNVSPELGDGGWHGFLTDGALVGPRLEVTS